MPSPIHYSIGSDTSGSLGIYNATTIEEGSSLSSSVQRNAYISEEPMMDTIFENTEVEGHTSTHSASILKPLSGLEIGDFISEIRARTASSSAGRFSISRNNIITTLRELVLDVNIEALPTIANFRSMTNSLLDCAVISGIDAEELLHWESVLREVEFGIYSIQIAREENSIEESEAAEAAYKDILERATLAHENLQRKHTDSRECQKNIVWASAEVLRIEMQLEELQQRKEYLTQRKEMINQDIAVMETDYTQIMVEISELEQISDPLSQQLEAASQHLQVIQDKHEYKAAQARAAIARIRGIQSRYA